MTPSSNDSTITNLRLHPIARALACALALTGCIEPDDADLDDDQFRLSVAYECPRWRCG